MQERIGAEERKGEEAVFIHPGRGRKAVLTQKTL